MSAIQKPNSHEEYALGRRSILRWLSSVALFGSAVISAFSNFVFMRPRATYGPPSRFFIGPPDECPPGTRMAIDAHRISVAREADKMAADLNNHQAKLFAFLTCVTAPVYPVFISV